jgi:hypothetical protein
VRLLDLTRTVRFCPNKLRRGTSNELSYLAGGDFARKTTFDKRFLKKNFKKNENRHQRDTVALPRQHQRSARPLERIGGAKELLTSFVLPIHWQHEHAGTTHE